MVYHKSFGNSQENTAYKEGDIFRIASMTKAITTVAFMQLFQNGFFWDRLYTVMYGALND